VTFASFALLGAPAHPHRADRRSKEFGGTCIGVMTDATMNRHARLSGLTTRGLRKQAAIIRASPRRPGPTSRSKRGAMLRRGATTTRRSAIAAARRKEKKRKRRKNVADPGSWHRDRRGSGNGAHIRISSSRNGAQLTPCLATRRDTWNLRGCTFLSAPSVRDSFGAQCGAL